MARLLIAALRRAGHSVELATELRTYLPDPSPETHCAIRREAVAETNRISALWTQHGPPDAWLCYHPYYKAPDLIGPKLALDFAVPYLTVEASYSSRRNVGGWEQSQQEVLVAIRQAAVNICLTKRDLDGLRRAAPSAHLTMLAPFIDTLPFMSHAPRPQPDRLITVAMMRKGDKLESYLLLAEALEQIRDIAWTLSIVGDGACRPQLQERYAAFGDRIEWHGEKPTEEIARLLSQSALYVWPGCGEAYGLAYLEAQAAGLPVVAMETAGVPEVVAAGRSGILTPEGDLPALASAIARLLGNEVERRGLAAAARENTRALHSIEGAAQRLDAILSTIRETRDER
ncbi:glycosyltransferase family 4 protein [Rhizobiaceae bacterium n13]|uniref:Glycosyltransferase family 4 protein n=2 Tax=Ferirhizobium litorale TaxID=2927786 RepID=A0AAE3U162_9HYPH|nr:glycosyltransferase family 4 protein [Fererhizobium litorale]MDI7861657.1 glycosyltransferase family 4 protein [Fererhizobium litorale]MDI7922001.1 glycosyltransferase family 4 protein [Fererhizobium litorale]